VKCDRRGDGIMSKERENVVIEPTPPKSLLRLLATLKPLDEDFPQVRDLAPGSVDLDEPDQPAGD
jgi:antitoxin VapB